MHSTWEIERKFLVTYVPEGLLATRSPVKIRQGYLALDRDRHVRIRDIDGCYTMTVKQGFGLKRLETEIHLLADQFEQLWPLTESMRVEKLRYSIGFFGNSLLFDDFQGHLAPLKLVEVEFTDEVTSRQFVPPDFAECEVTAMEAYQNVNLARHGVPKSVTSMLVQ